MRHFRAEIYPGLAAVALLAVAVSGVFAPFSPEDLSENTWAAERIPVPVQNRAEPDPVALSLGSPFSPDREPYARPVIAPELIGIVVENGERSAVVLLDGVESTLQVGSETEAGRVAFIGLDSVRFEGEQTQTISLFD